MKCCILVCVSVLVNVSVQDKRTRIQRPTINLLEKERQNSTEKYRKVKKSTVRYGSVQCST